METRLTTQPSSQTTMQCRRDAGVHLTPRLLAIMIRMETAHRLLWLSRSHSGPLGGVMTGLLDLPLLRQGAACIDVRMARSHSTIFSHRFLYLYRSVSRPGTTPWLIK